MDPETPCSPPLEDTTEQNRQKREGSDELILQLFQKLGWSFTLSSSKSILIPQNMEEILLAADYQYFCKITFPQQRLTLLIPVIKQYMKKALLSTINAKVEKELLSQNIKTWISLIIHLFANSPMNQLFIEQILECSNQAQEYYMVLMREIAENIKQEEGSESKLTGIDEIENQLREKSQELLEVKAHLQKMKQENTSLKTENDKLIRTLSEMNMERVEQLDSVGVSDMDQLIILYKQALTINQKLSSTVQKFENENIQLQEMYSGVTNDLIIAQHQNEEKDSVLRTRVSTVRRRSNKGMRFATNSDSDEEISYKDSIEMHAKPLREEIGHLNKYSRNLKYQMRMLYKEFTKFTAELKPFKEEGMFQDVLRSVF